MVLVVKVLQSFYNFAFQETSSITESKIFKYVVIVHPVGVRSILTQMMQYIPIYRNLAVDLARLFMPSAFLILAK